MFLIGGAIGKACGEVSLGLSLCVWPISVAIRLASFTALLPPYNFVSAPLEYKFGNWESGLTLPNPDCLDGKVFAASQRAHHNHNHKL